MIPQKDLLLNPENVYNKIKELIDKYRKDIETKDIFYYKYLLNEIKNTSFWNIYCSSNKICMHIYRNGKNAGEICGKKVFIESNDKKNKFLCSRHCRSYNPKNRIYDELHKRCLYIRKNGENCKHKCEKNNNFCYIHKEKEQDKHIESFEIAPSNFNVSNMYRDSTSDDLSLKKIFLKKLKKKRDLYFFRKKNKNKYINNNIIIKYIENIEIPNLYKILKISKNSEKYNNYNYNNKIIYIK